MHTPPEQEHKKLEPTSENGFVTPQEFGVLGSMINWFAHNAIAANLLMILVIVLGVVGLQKLNIESFPELEPSVVGVDVVYDIGSAKDVEEGLTVKLESAVEQIEGVKRVTSFSQPQGARLTIEKKPKHDLDQLEKDVKDAMAGLYGLPSGAETPIVSKAKMQKDALWVSLAGDTDIETLMKLAQSVKSDLLKQSSIYEVSFFGMPQRIIAIEVDDKTLQSHGLSIADINRAINSESTKANSTSIRDGKKKIRLTATEQKYHPNQFKQIILKTNKDGSRLTVGDIATVQNTIEDDPQIITKYNGHKSISVRIFAGKNTNIKKVVTQANSVVKKWQTKLPNNVSIDSWLDQSVSINDRLQLLFSNAMTGFFFVFIILALFLQVRIAFWVAIGLPFIFFGTFHFMGAGYADLTINYITTFGFIMALGIVVDDAVVVGESIYSSRQRFGDNIASTVSGTLAVAKPTILGVLTTIVTFMSLSFIESNVGKIYAQFGTVVAICLMLSVVESKFILPAHLAHLNTQKNLNAQGWQKYNVWKYVQFGADALMNKANRGFQTAIQIVLRFRYASLLILLSMFVLVIGMPISGKIKTVFFPDIPGDVLMVQSRVSNEAGYLQNHRNLKKIEQTLYQADMQLVQERDVQNNNNEDGTELETTKNNVNPLLSSDSKVRSGLKSVMVYSGSDLSGDLYIELAKDASYNSKELVKVWKEKTGTPAGTEMLKYVTNFMRGDDFNVSVRGNDMNQITLAGNELKAILSKVEGVSGLDDNFTPNKPQIMFALTESGRALGLTTADIARQVLQNFGGGVVQKFQRDKSEVKVKIRLPESARSGLNSLQTAMIRTPSGNSVPLSTVATMSQGFTTDSIRRIDGMRSAYLKAKVDKDIIDAVELVKQLRNTDMPKLEQRYPDVEFNFAGEAERKAETTSSMTFTFMVALLVIYMILAIALNSYMQPMLIMAVIPFGIVGAILGHWISGISLSIFSMNGILALTGVVINDSLLLISKYNENTKRGMQPKDAIAEAASSRFRAVILTSLTTFFGLLPLLFETSTQAQFLKPAAASLAYGILFATVITLVLIPLLINIATDLAFWKKWKKV